LEEPEIGLHPDAIGILGKLLKEAAKRTQLIVTTHSDLLVSEFRDTPESIVICERDDQGTHLKRLEPETYKKWLKDYSIGDLWLRGDLGGTL
jgi:predicted ATPase